jgi:hypothetical protein
MSQDVTDFNMEDDDPPPPDDGSDEGGEGGLTGSSDGSPYSGIGVVGDNSSDVPDDSDEVIGYYVDTDAVGAFVSGQVDAVLQILGDELGFGAPTILIPTNMLNPGGTFDY